MAPTATVLFWDIVTSYLNPVLWQSPNCLANYHLSSASRVIILKTWFKLCHSVPNHSFLFFLTKVKSEFLTMVLHAVAYHPLSDLLSNLLPKSLLQDLCACCILSIKLITLEWLEDGSHQLCFGRCSGALQCLGQTVVPIYIPPPILTFLMWIDGFLVGATPTPGGVLNTCVGQVSWGLESTPPSSSPGWGNSEVG